MAGRKTEFRDSSGLLYQINKPDGSQIKLTYDNDKALKSITDIDGYKVMFEYTSTASGKKVSAIQEYGKTAQQVRKLHLTVQSIIQRLKRHTVRMESQTQMMI